MPFASSFRRSAGLLTATTLGLSAAVLSATGMAQAAPPPWTTTGSGIQAPIPAGICAVEWTAIGGGSGNDSEGVPGGSAGKIIAKVAVETDDVFTLYPGAAGTDGAGPTPGTGGASADPDPGAQGEDGASDGSASGGGGGAASTVVRGGDTVLSAYGADAYDPEGLGGLGGGGGVNVAPGLYEDNIDGDGGDGTITDVGIECMPATPSLGYAEPLDSATRLYFVEGYDGDLPTTGYEYTKDGGTTWSPLTDVAPEDGKLVATIGGLTNGTEYTVSIRAVGGPGISPSAASDPQTVTPRKKPSAPTNVKVTTGEGTLTVSWSPSTAGTYPIIGYDVDLTWVNPGGQSGGGAPFCHTGPTVYTCTAPAQPGVTHDLVIAAADSSSYGLGEPAFATSGIVPASRTVPKSTGDLTLPAGKTSTVPAGQKMTVSGTGYSPFSVVTVLIYSEPRVLTTVRTDGSGSFSVEVTVPEGLPAGQHTLVAAGIDPMGAMRYLTLPVTVSGTGTATLAYTGADVTLPTIGGLLAVLVGGGLLLVSRRRSVD